MSREWLRESVADVPAGLIFCRIDGEARPLLRLSPRSILVMSMDEIPFPASITLHICQIRTGTYRSIVLHNVQAGPVQRLEGAVQTLFFFEDSEAATAIRCALNDYARYVELRGNWGADAYGQYLTGYPLEQEDAFPDDPRRQRRTWYAALGPMPEPKGELALALNDPSLWRMYLEHPAAELMQAYAHMRQIPPEILPRRIPQRLYVGNPHCGLLFPDADTLAAIESKAAREGIKLTLVTAQLRYGGEDRMDALLSLAQRRGYELEANDFGTLQRACTLSQRPIIALGTRLNRRRKDPRMNFKAGMNAHPELLRENAVNDAAYRAWLRQFGVERYEFERCGYDFALPDGPSSLHLPFYQTNTGLWCPLRALCEWGDRGKQCSDGNCPQWCTENELVYPDHLHLSGRWNSLLALDARAWNPEWMNHFDRWVLNF